MTVEIDFDLGSYSSAVRTRLASWDLTGFSERLWLKDPTLWSREPQPELQDRLGWLDLPAELATKTDAYRRFGDEVGAEGIRDAVVLGMGGSSLAPEVFASTFDRSTGRPKLTVLDSTHPRAVDHVARSIDPAATLFIVSSKSGGTLETLSFFRYFWNRIAEAEDDPGRRFVAVTDPGSSLEALAEDRGFRRTFLAPPEVGGRYSALSEFGMVPAALIGADLDAMQRSAHAMAVRIGPDAPSSSNDGIVLGAAIGELARAGRDKLTLLTGERYRALPAWIEQLVAESTGKEQRGVIPIGGEQLAADLDVYGQDRTFLIVQRSDEAGAVGLELAERGHPVVTITTDDDAEIAGVMFLLEVAVAVAGAVIEIHPFNQPDVQLAKDLANRAMEGRLDVAGLSEVAASSADLSLAVATWLSEIAPGEYVGIHMWTAPTDQARTTIEAARLAIRDQRRIATTLDFGPRFLHSTGQLHKGGPNSGRFVQVVDRPSIGLAVPETDYTFDDLFVAQGLGDLQALLSRDRNVLRVVLGDDTDSDLQLVTGALEAAARG